MRVLYIITDLATGGAEMMLLKLLERLDRERYTPMVISLSTTGDIGRRIEAFGIPVRALGMTSGLSSLPGFFRLIRQVRRFKPDIVHTWLYHADLLGGLAARLAGVKAVCWGIRSSNLDPDKIHWTTRAIRRVCALLSAVIPRCIFLNSETGRRIHVALGYAAKKMVVIPNGFDLCRFKPDVVVRGEVLSEIGVSLDTPLVGLIGRFDPQKNHAGFFEAAGRLHRRLPSVHFVLAGKGIDGSNDEIISAIHNQGVGEVTHLLGMRGDIPRLMAALDILASSSYGEAFSNVLGEAMACGVPCAVTDVGDSAYIVGDTGRVVPAGDMEGLAEAMISLLTLSAVERASLGKRARARVASHFEIGRVVHRFEEEYESLRKILS